MDPRNSHPAACRVASSLLAGVMLTFSAHLANAQISNLAVRVMAANTTSGNNQSYETPGIRIFKGFRPDIVAIQEFRYNSSSSPGNLRTLVDTAFGTHFHFYVEPTGNIPNGIVSRWPILNAGSWEDTDTGVNDRGYAWAQIDLPGTNDLYVVSVHFKAGEDSGPPSDAERRAAEAAELKSLILVNLPTNGWIVVAGDMNLYSESEEAIITLKTFLSDSPVPVDQNGDPDTNAGRSERYDRVLPSFALSNRLTPVLIGTNTFPNGLVFDSHVYNPLSDVHPIAYDDSHASGMQHMAVIKDFLLPVFITNTPSGPLIVTQPQSRTNTVGTLAEFSVAATGTPPLSYQWRFNGTNIAGATATDYAFASVQTTNAGDYTVFVTNTAGSVTSTVATLTVIVPPTNAPPAIIIQPASQTNTAGSTARFTVVATGTEPLHYQWRFDGTNLGNATNSFYSKPNVQTSDAGPYDVVVTNAAGAVTSTPALLTLTQPNTNGFTGLLAGWDVSGQTNFGVSPFAPSSNADNLKILGLTRGAGVLSSSTAANRAWGGNGFDSVDAATAVSAEEFASFALEANAGFTVSFNSISQFDYRRSSTGPANGLLQYQVGGGAFTDIAPLAYTSSSSGGASLAAIDLSGISALQNLGPGTNVTFRVVNYGGTSSGGTWYVFDKAVSTAPDLVIEGSVNPIPSSPPAEAPVLGMTQLIGDQFIFQLTGTTASHYVVEATTNLATWTPIETNAAPFWFTNPARKPTLFFRGGVAP